MTVQEAVQLLLLEAQEENSPTSQHVYRWHANEIAKDFGADTNLADITKIQVQQWVNQLRQKMKPSSILHKIAFIRRMYRIAEDHGLPLTPPTYKLRVGKLNNKKTRVLHHEEEARSKKFFKPWIWKMVQIFLHTGVRRIEAMRIKPEHLQIEQVDSVNAAGNKIEVYRGYCEISDSKTGEARVICLNHEACEALIEFLRAARETNQEYVLPPHSYCRLSAANYLGRQIVKAFQQAGVKGVSPHTLRHTFATRAMEAGANEAAIGHQLGHSSPISTKRYVHRSPKHQWPAVEAISQFKFYANEVPGAMHPTRIGFQSNPSPGQRNQQGQHALSTPANYLSSPAVGNRLRLTI